GSTDGSGTRRAASRECRSDSETGDAKKRQHKPQTRLQHPLPFRSSVVSETTRDPVLGRRMVCDIAVYVNDPLPLLGHEKGPAFAGPFGAAFERSRAPLAGADLDLGRRHIDRAIAVDDTAEIAVVRRQAAPAERVVVDLADCDGVGRRRTGERV